MAKTSAVTGIHQLRKIYLVKVRFCNCNAGGASAVRNKVSVFSVKKFNIKAFHLVQNRHKVPCFSLAYVNTFVMNNVQLLLISKDAKFIHCHRVSSPYLKVLRTCYVAKLNQAQPHNFVQAANRVHVYIVFLKDTQGMCATAK